MVVSNSYCRIGFITIIWTSITRILYCLWSVCLVFLCSAPWLTIRPFDVLSEKPCWHYWLWCQIDQPRPAPVLGWLFFTKKLRFAIRVQRLVGHWGSLQVCVGSVQFLGQEARMFPLSCENDFWTHQANISELWPKNGPEYRLNFFAWSS